MNLWSKNSQFFLQEVPKILVIIFSSQAQLRNRAKVVKSLSVCLKVDSEFRLTRVLVFRLSVPNHFTKNSKIFTDDSWFISLQLSCWTFPQKVTLCGSKNISEQTATTRQISRGSKIFHFPSYRVILKFPYFLQLKVNLFYYIYFHWLNFIWGSFPGLKIWVFLLYLPVCLHLVVSRMETVFFGRNKLFSRHSCSICFYLKELVLILRKMHTSSMSWCMVEMPICHEIDDTHW